MPGEGAILLHARALMAGIKRAFAPLGILDPGRSI
jgi:hypothetical protein